MRDYVEIDQKLLDRPHIAADARAKSDAGDHLLGS
jgi:hypothetical protein